MWGEAVTGVGFDHVQVYFEWYNRRFCSSGERQALEWRDLCPQIEEFKRKHIYRSIIETELKEMAYPHRSHCTYVCPISLGCPMAPAVPLYPCPTALSCPIVRPQLSYCTHDPRPSAVLLYPCPTALSCPIVPMPHGPQLSYCTHDPRPSAVLLYP